MKKQHKKLEDTIRELRQRYKNVPSPLSQQINHLNENVNFIPQRPQPANFRDNLVGEFKPQQQRFF